MAHFITTLRLLLLIPLVFGALQSEPGWHYVALYLTAIIFPLDALDGFVARRLNEASQFGAFYDIAADRLIELTLWWLSAWLGLAPLWAALIITLRGVATDIIRATLRSRHIHPLSVGSNIAWHWIVASPALRFSYAATKMATFLCLLYLHYAGAGSPIINHETLRTIADGLIFTTVGLCLLRGLPILLYAYRNGSTLTDNAG